MRSDAKEEEKKNGALNVYRTVLEMNGTEETAFWLTCGKYPDIDPERTRERISQESGYLLRKAHPEKHIVSSVS